jgi:HEAT repeat-containing protein 5
MLTAAHCAKTLILAATSGTHLLHHCIRKLTPAMVEYIVKVAPSIHDRSVSEMQAAATDEVWKAFLSIFVSMGDPQREFIFL